MDSTKTGEQKSDLAPLLLASSPHFVSPINTAALMRNMLIALAPVSLFGIIIFGLPALLNIVVAVAAAIASETLFRFFTKQKIRVKDLSAGVTGLLLALVIPPSMPLWMTALGSVFGVIVAKEFFGGLGTNVFNPALIGRAFLMMSFPASMTRWHEPQAGFALSLPDATSSASLLYTTQSGTVFADPYWQTIKTLFYGYRAGCTGETSIMLILAAFVFLLVTRTVDWRTPVTVVLTAGVTAFALGLDPLFTILSGGLIFGAVYMATDYVTSPLLPLGKIIFGIGVGLIAVLIRKWGTYPEGVSYAILIMNCAVPFLNRLVPRKYGFVQKKKARLLKESSPPKGGG